MPNNPSKPSWKGEDRTALPSGRRAGAGTQYSWKSSGATSAAPRGRKLWATLISVLGLLCIAGLVWLWMQIRTPRSTCLIVLAPDFQSTAEDLTIPLSVYGDRAGRDFIAFAKAGDRSSWCSVLGDRAWPLESSEPKSNWKRHVASAKESTLLIFVSLPGTTDEQGLPVLITDSGGRHDVTKILEELKKLPPAKKKLLVFDSTATPSDWRRDILFNQFAQGLISIKKQIEAVPNLLVFCASSPGERSWVSEELGHSVFAHYLFEGLAGGPIASNRGGPVYAADLFGYVHDRCDEWAQRNRAHMTADKEQLPFRQRPFSLPDDESGKTLANQFLLSYGDRDYEADKIPKLRQLDDSSLKSLKSGWERCDRLAEKTPRPWVATPRLWRRYLELLLRYETMVRAGESQAAGNLDKVILGIENQLDAERLYTGKLPLSASVALPAALGCDFNVTDSQFTLISERPDAEVSIGIKGLGGDETVARTKYLDFLIRRLIQSPGEINKFTAKMTAADNGGKNRPAEAHLAIMLAKYDQPGWQRPSDELISLALTVRQLAERATLSIGLGQGYPYSERLPAALWKEIQSADTNRRQGEDLLFSASPANHARAKELLEKAQTGYQKVRQLQTQIWPALGIRDEVFAALPGLTNWYALARPKEIPVEKVEALWRDAHSLADRLASLDPLDPAAPSVLEVIEAPKNETNGRTLVELTTAVRRVLDDLKSIFAQSVTNELNSKLVTQTARQQIEYLLTAPSIKAEDRIQLVKRSREISAHFALNKDPVRTGKYIGEKELAEYQPRLARANLGQTLMNEMGQAPLRPYDELKDDNDQRLGPQLFGHWKKLMTETDKAMQNEGSKIAAPLPRRERLSLVAGTSTSQATEPAKLARDLRWQNTFRHLAARVELDSWFDEKNQPEFKRLAEQYYAAISDAELNTQKSRLNGLLDQSQLTVDPPAKRTLTSDPNVDVRFHVHKLPDNLEPGFATVTPRLSREGVLRFKDEFNPASYPVSLAKDAEERIPLKAIEALDKIGEVPDFHLELTSYYRGQYAKRAVAQLPVKPFPDLVINKPQPIRGAQIAARTDPELDPGALAIILDCSGSMRYENGVDVNIKFPAAKAALEKLQAKIPQGTKVTLWAYGHKGKNDIEHLLPGELITWDNNDPKIKNLLFEKVKDLPAVGYTPLLNAMKEAVDEEHFKNYEGFKTLLVLTDGCDQESDQAPDNKAVADRFKRDFINDKDRKKVGIRMVLFKLGHDADKVAKNAREQFAGLSSVNSFSKLYEVSDVDKLYQQLAESIRIRLSVFQNNQAVLEDVLTRLPGDPLDWSPNPPLKAGDYDVVVRGERQRISLENGDQLILGIHSARRGLAINRRLKADEPKEFRWRILAGHTEDSPYVLSLVEEGVSNVKKARFALEDRKSARETSRILQMDRPRFIWWEFRPIGSKDIPPRTTVTSISMQPAPVWDISCENWPNSGGNQMPAEVEVWASPTDPRPAHVHMVPAKKEIIDEPAGGTGAILESVRFETVSIVANETGQKVPQNCLVVRVHSPQGGRYIAEIDGTVLAESHRYFFESNRYTAVFLLPEHAKQSDVRLKLISVDATKAKLRPLSRELTR